MRRTGRGALRRATAALLLALAQPACDAQPLTAPPIFGQMRLDGGHSGHALSALGPGASAAPTVTRSFVGGAGGIAGQPVVASDGTAIYIDAVGTVWAAQPGAAVPLWSFSMGSAPTADIATAAISPDGSVVVVVAAATFFILNATSGAELYSTPTFFTVTQPPTILLDGSLVVIESFNSILSFELEPPYSRVSYGYTSVSPITADSDLLLGNCYIYVLPENVVEKKCLGGAGSIAWQVQLPESSTLPPVVGDGVVFIVTSVSGFVIAIDSATGDVICNSTNVLAPVTMAPAYIGRLYGIAFPIEGPGVVYVTQSGTTACAGAAVIPFALASTFGPIVVDFQSIGYLSVYTPTVGVPVVFAIDFAATPQPVVVWNYTMRDAASSMLSWPAIGADNGLAFVRLSPSDGLSAEVTMIYPSPSLCPPGEFSQLNATCASCPEGTYSGPVNASAPTVACTPCEAGSSSPANSSDASACVLCAAGHFAPGGGGPCLSCASGSFGPSPGLSACDLCPAGTASAAVNATSPDACIGCVPGAAQPAAGSAACAACVSGTYADAANATSCTAALPNCFTSPSSSLACGAAIPFAAFGIDSTHSALSSLAGPSTAPTVSVLTIFSGQDSLPVSGLAVGPSGGIVAGRPYDGLVFLGLSDDIFAVSPVNGAIVNNYSPPSDGSSFDGSPAVSSWGSVYLVSSAFSLIALPFNAAGAPLFITPPAAQTAGYTVTAPTVHSARRAVFYSAASAGVLAVDGYSGTQLWAWVPEIDPGSGVPYACSTSPALDAAGLFVFVGCDDFNVVALNASTGVLVWSRPLSAVVRAALAVSPDGALVFAATDANNLVALNSATGASEWMPVAVSPSAVRATPAVVPGLGVVGATRGGVVFLANGSAAGGVAWATTLSNGTAAPAVSAVTIGANGSAYVACEDGSLFALSIATGAVQWRLALGEPLFAQPVLLAGGGSGGTGGVLLLPSRRTSALYVVSGLTATATPSATASATASANATASASASATASASGTASATASAAGTASASGNGTATASAQPASGGNAAGEGLGTSGTIAVSVVVPAVILAGLAAAVLASRRRGSGLRSKSAAAAVETWRGATSYGTAAAAEGPGARAGPGGAPGPAGDGAQAAAP